MTLSAPQVERSLRSSTFFDRAVRAGLVVYALLHLLVAVLSFRLVFTGHRQMSQGALAQLAQDTWGLPIVVALPVGFAALCIWQLLAAAVGYRDLDARRRTLMRLGAACRVIGYAYLAYAILNVVAHRHSEQVQTTSPRAASADVLAQPLGRVMLAAVGLVIAAIGIGLLVFAVRGQFVDQLAEVARSHRVGYPIIALGYVGYAAKGAAFALVGVLVLWAGVTDNPRETGGLDHSLQRLLGAAWGTAAIALFGTGLACFGMYLLARARFLRRRTLTA